MRAFTSSLCQSCHFSLFLPGRTSDKTVYDLHLLRRHKSLLFSTQSDRNTRPTWLNKTTNTFSASTFLHEEVHVSSTAVAAHYFEPYASTTSSQHPRTWVLKGTTSVLYRACTCAPRAPPPTDGAPLTHLLCPMTNGEQCNERTNGSGVRRNQISRRTPLLRGRNSFCRCSRPYRTQMRGSTLDGSYDSARRR